MQLPVYREYEAYSLREVSNTVAICSRTNPLSITLYMSRFFRLNA